MLEDALGFPHMMREIFENKFKRELRVVNIEKHRYANLAKAVNSDVGEGTIHGMNKELRVVFGYAERRSDPEDVPMEAALPD